ncbi:MAG: OmpH family outer membrane protein [Candidatus Erginobacter occultus]|nr:OmpH family outer membrane protein [Candidatus Erginobacter occultus]
MKLFFTLVMVFSLFAGGGFAEEAAETGADRIAWIDLPEVMQEYGRAEEMVADFEKEKADREAEVEKVIAEIERLEGEMLLLSDQAKAARREEILKKKISVNAMIEQAERELSRQSMLRQGKLLEEISAAAEKVARREGYDFVIRGEVLLYQNPEREITDGVIAELNRE